MSIVRRSLGRDDVPVVVLWPLIDALEDIGGDARALLRRNGVFDPARFQDGAAKISRERFAAIAGEALAELHLYSARQSGARGFLLPAFQMMCRAMLSASDLRGAIDVAIAFSRLMGEQDAGALEMAGGEAFFRISPMGRDLCRARFLVAAFGAAVMHRLFGWLIGDEIALSRVDFDFPQLPASELMLSLFGVEPRFRAPATGFAFAGSALDKPVIRSGADLDRFFRLFPFDLFPPEYRAGSMSEQVRSAIRGAMARGEAMPGLEQIAANNGVSVSTLRRRLADEGQSMNGLRRALQEEAAVAMLSGGRRRIADVAARVGFTDAATFSKAFRLWTGRSPAEWRRIHHPTVRRPEQ